MVKTVSKLLRKLIRVISDKTVPKSVRFIIRSSLKYFD